MSNSYPVAEATPLFPARFVSLALVALALLLCAYPWWQGWWPGASAYVQGWYWHLGLCLLPWAWAWPEAWPCQQNRKDAQALVALALLLLPSLTGLPEEWAVLWPQHPPVKVLPASVLLWVLPLAALLHSPVSWRVHAWGARFFRWLPVLLLMAGALLFAVHGLDLALIYGDESLFYRQGVAAVPLLLLLGWRWALQQEVDARLRQDQHESRINQLGSLFLLGIALMTGLLSFGMLKRQMEQTLVTGLNLTRDNRAIVLQNALDAAYLDVAPLLQRAEYRQSLSHALNQPEAKVRQAELQQLVLAMPFLAQHAALLGPKNQLLAHLGTPVPEQVLWVDYREQAEIMLVLHQRSPQIWAKLTLKDEHGEALGHLLFATANKSVDQLFSDTYDLGNTGDMLVCGSHESQVQCISARHHERAFAPRLSNAFADFLQEGLEGEANKPGLLPLAYDPHGEWAVVSYAPVGRVGMALHVAGNGLAMVVSQQVREFYQPLRSELERLLPLSLAVILLGGWTLRRHIRPLFQTITVNEHRFRDFTEISSDWYWEIDANLLLQQMAGRLVKDLGLQAWERQTPLHQLLKDSPDVNAFYLLLESRHAFRDFELRLQRPERNLTLLINGTPIHDARGQFQGFRGVGKNITPRKEAERELGHARAELEARVEARTSELLASNRALASEVAERRQAEADLRRSEARFKSLTALSSDWYWEWNAQFQFVLIAGDVEHKGGFSVPQSLGRPLWEQLWLDGEHDWALLQAKLDAHLPFHDFVVQIRDYSGHRRHLALSGHPVLDSDNRCQGYRGIGKDVTEQRETEARVHFLAHYDPLTKLPNRVLLGEQVKFAVDRAKRQAAHFALLFIDLDRFKNINDSLGHDVGDLVLQETARRLNQCVRDTDMVCRLGGDEFVVILEGLQDAQRARNTAERIVEAVSDPLTLGGEVHYLGASIGISIYPEDGENLGDLLKHSDAAMYRVKEQGRNGYMFYSEPMHREAMDTLRLEQDLRLALNQHELRLLFQPKLDLQRGSVVGVEALVRWQHPTRGLVNPGEFIGVAEASGLIQPLGLWVLEQALDALVRFDEAGIAGLGMAVNVSSKQLSDPQFCDRILRLLEQSGLAPERLELEMTETALMQRPKEDSAKLPLLREHGVHIALDDFGTGYSSLSSLAKLPIDRVKVDRSFIQELPHNVGHVSITQSIISMAHTMGLQVVAEGIERLEQAEWLAQAGCDLAQGFWIAIPMEEQELIRWQQAQRRQALARLERSPPAAVEPGPEAPHDPMI